MSSLYRKSDIELVRMVRKCRIKVRMELKRFENEKCKESWENAKNDSEMWNIHESKRFAHIFCCIVNYKE